MPAEYNDLSIDDFANAIPDGAKLAIPADYAGVTMVATRALIRRKAKNLHLVGVPTSGLQAELLIGAGCVATLESSALTLGEYGPAPRFTKAVREGSIRLVDATCPAIHAGLQASQKGIPFMPLRGILGSDVLEYHPAWKVIQNPFSENEDPIVAIPAIQPDIALFHAPLADRDGNVWLGRKRELVNMSHASKSAFVTVDEIRETSLFETEEMAAGVLPALYVGKICHAPNGSWPLPFWNGAKVDDAHMREYMKMAASDAGFNEYLERYIFGESVMA
ncbi:CoA transferase [uncultured Sneathiella sp.]|uniref:CoA transferase subunit A n=1 Tax=uncultured Sneathiella sp. TaxID=879315 RepID=UPI0030D94FE8|tara:strand:- start:1062 stop:1892 length:831 start_codon:yes stop_codon:yes gene_type:complete